MVITQSLSGKLVDIMARISLSQFSDLLTRSFKNWAYLKDDNASWQQVITHNPLANSEYLINTVEYHLAYLVNAENCAVVIYDQQQPIAIWPLTLNNNGEKQILQSNCKSIMPPLFHASATKKQIKKVYQQCLALLKTYFQLTAIQPLVCYTPASHVLWQRTLTPHICDVSYIQYLLTDLSKSINDIKSDFRKSYRSLINKGMQLWQCDIHQTMSDQTIEEFRQFHIQTAGKETRSLATWQRQQQMVNSGEAFYITLRDSQQILVGAALFNLSPQQASYSIGVYERSLFDQPIGHVAQWRAIEHMKSIGITQYFLGNRHHPFESSKPSEKESAIGFFKEGFSNQVSVETQALLFFKE